MDAPHYLIVRFWVAPEAEERVLAWLENHVVEVVAQPGFLSARCIRLDETDSLGWRAFYAVYGVESKAALNAYLENPVRQRFAREQIPFASVMRLERNRGAGECLTKR